MTRSDHSAILVQLLMEIIHLKKKLEKELLKEIKHSMQLELSLKANVQKIQIKVILVSN